MAVLTLAAMGMASLILTTTSSSSAAILLTSGDLIIGGQSDTIINFTQGMVGTTAGVNNWPGAEPPTDFLDGLYGGGGQKYLNFAEIQTGVIITPNGLTGGLPTIVTSMTLWVANDSDARDPADYELYGTNVSIVDGGAGTEYPLSSFTLIVSGALSLPDARNTSTMAASGPPYSGNFQTVAITNSTQYTSYMLLFPNVKNAGSANSMQISEVQFEGVIVPEPATLALAALGLPVLLRRRRA